MCQRIDDAAVEQAHGGHAERRIHRRAIAAVAVLQQGGGAVSWQPVAVDDRDRDARAVPGARPQPLGRVVGRVVAAQYRVALQQPTLAASDVDFVGRVRRGQ
jgi:hypothetical protein